MAENTIASKKQPCFLEVCVYSSFPTLLSETFAWQSRFRRILCSMKKTTFNFTLHRLVKARNAYTVICYKEGKKPLLPSLRKTKDGQILSFLKLTPDLLFVTNYNRGEKKWKKFSFPRKQAMIIMPTDCFRFIADCLLCVQQLDGIQMAQGSPTIKIQQFIWALPVWGGGSKPLPGWFVAPIFRRNVHVQTGICMILPENRCHRVPV